jgi:hypothetical protein
MDQIVERDSRHAKHDHHPEHLAPDRRRAKGKSLRDKVPRQARSTWKPPKNRRNLIDLLNKSNAGRLPDLVPIRFGRMMQSTFAFYRGTAAVTAADLASTPVSGIRVQACGDAHLTNVGGFPDAIGEFASEYADQAQFDYRTFVKAVSEGRIKASVESQRHPLGVEPTSFMGPGISDRSAKPRRFSPASSTHGD